MFKQGLILLEGIRISMTFCMNIIWAGSFTRNRILSLPVSDRMANGFRQLWPEPAIASLVSHTQGWNTREYIEQRMSNVGEVRFNG